MPMLPYCHFFRPPFCHAMALLRHFAFDAAAGFQLRYADAMPPFSLLPLAAYLLPLMPFRRDECARFRAPFFADSRHGAFCLSPCLLSPVISMSLSHRCPTFVHILIERSSAAMPRSAGAVARGVHALIASKRVAFARCGDIFATQVMDTPDSFLSRSARLLKSVRRTAFGLLTPTETFFDAATPLPFRCPVADIPPTRFRPRR